MARLVGVDLPRDKRLEIALTYIYGIGRSLSNEILAATGIDRDLRTKDLTDDQLARLRDYIEGNVKVEGDLRREVQADIRRKIEIGCYQVCDTAGVCRCAANGPKRTRGPAKVPSAPSQARRRPGNLCHRRRRLQLPKGQKTRRREKKNIPTARPTSRAPSTTPS